MTHSIAAPLLAVDLGGLEIVIFIVIGIIGWIVKLVNQQNQPAQPPPRQPRRPANEKLNREIDVFLQEVSGRKKPDEPVQIEVVPDSELRKRRAERQPVRKVQRQVPRPAQRQQLRPVPAPPPARSPVVPQTHVRPGQEIAERHSIDPSRLGSSLQSHVSQYMGTDRIDQEVQQHLKHDVEKSVEQHLGRFGSGASVDLTMTASTVRTAESARDIVRLLRDPDGVRQAILINEVLGKPLGLRKR